MIVGLMTVIGGFKGGHKSIDSSANSAKRVDVIAKGSLSARNYGAWSGYLDMKLEVQLVDPSSVKVGDYFDIKFKNASYAFNDILLNKEVKDVITDKTIGVSRRYSGPSAKGNKALLIEPNINTLPASNYTHEDFFTEIVYRVTITDREIEKSSSISMRFAKDNTYQEVPVPSSVGYKMPVVMYVNDDEVSGGEVNVGPREFMSKNFSVRHNNNSEYALNSKGELSKLSQSGNPDVAKNGMKAAFSIYSVYGNNTEKHLEKGDIIDYELPGDDHDWVIESKYSVGQVISHGSCDGGSSYDNRYVVPGVNTNVNGVVFGVLNPCIKYRVVEFSKNRAKFIVEESIGKNYYQALLTLKTSKPLYDVLQLNNGILRPKRSSAANVVIKSSGGGTKFTGNVNIPYNLVKSSSIVEGINILKEDSGNSSTPLPPNITATPQTIKVGQTPDPKDHLPEELKKEFETCEIRYKESPKTDTAGIIDTIIVISCPGQDDREVNTKIYVLGGNDIFVKKGEKPDPKLHIPNFDEKFPGCTIKYKNQPDTSKAGKVDAEIVISCPGEDDKEIDVRIIVTQNQSIKVGETPDPKKHIPNFDEEFPGCTVKYKNRPDTSKAGKIDAEIVISCPGKEDQIVKVQIEVSENPQQPQSSKIDAPHTGAENNAQIPALISISAAILSVIGIAFGKNRKF